jgi:hypothetical protein
VIEIGEPCELGLTEGARLGFSLPTRQTPDGERFNSRKLLLDGDEAFDLSFWTGTCSFLFERLSGANQTLSLDALQDRLNDGLDGLAADVLTAFGSLLPSGHFLPMLFALEPHLVVPGDERDYFTHEQLETWRIDPFWGLRHSPRTPYYRSFETSVPGGTAPAGSSGDGHLFEFVVPMVPPNWNDAGRVSDYKQRLAHSARPTAVALSLLDICQPAVLEGEESGYYAHWCVTHFLLDGHHKLQAASEERRAVRLLSIVSIDHSLATLTDIQRLALIRDRPYQRRLPA